MKRLLLFLLVIGLLIVPSSLAKENLTESARVEYTLPYSGMLPDSPLYFLKAFRDRLIATFISDPIKKAEFDLLQADKRLSAAIALFEKGKKDLAESTISKGENYFEDGLKNLDLAKRQGREIGGLVTNMELSAKKHLEVLSKMKMETSGDLLAKFEVLEKRILGYQDKVLDFKASLQQ